MVFFGQLSSMASCQLTNQHKADIHRDMQESGLQTKPHLTRISNEDILWISVCGPTGEHFHWKGVLALQLSG